MNSLAQIVGYIVITYALICGLTTLITTAIHGRGSVLLRIEGWDLEAMDHQARGMYARKVCFVGLLIWPWMMMGFLVFAKVRETESAKHKESCLKQSIPGVSR